MASTTWGDLRDTVRRALLKDTTPDEETGEYRWSDLELRDFCWWSLDSFCIHTAVATSTSYDTDGVETDFDIPENWFDGDKFETTTLVYCTVGSTITYYDPVMMTEEMNLEENEGYRQIPGNKIRFTTAPSEGTLTIEFFAYYNYPYADSDTVDVPQWGVTPLSYLIAAHALSGYSMRAANIRQYNTNRDSGNPSQNPLKDQQDWWMQLYDRAMAEVLPQDRTTFFRESYQ